MELSEVHKTNSTQITNSQPKPMAKTKSHKSNHDDNLVIFHRLWVHCISQGYHHDVDKNHDLKALTHTLTYTEASRSGFYDKGVGLPLYL